VAIINTHHSRHVTRGTDLIQYRLSRRLARPASFSFSVAVYAISSCLPRCVGVLLASRQTECLGPAGRRPTVVVISRQDEPRPTDPPTDRLCCRSTQLARSPCSRLDGIMGWTCGRTRRPPGALRLQRTARTHFRFCSRRKQLRLQSVV
jgi:hypothetical protein